MWGNVLNVENVAAIKNAVMANHHRIFLFSYISHIHHILPHSITFTTFHHISHISSHFLHKVFFDLEIIDDESLAIGGVFAHVVFQQLLDLRIL